VTKLYIVATILCWQPGNPEVHLFGGTTFIASKEMVDFDLIYEHPSHSVRGQRERSNDCDWRTLRSMTTEARSPVRHQPTMSIGRRGSVTFMV
jgi:hypothetical protein